MFFWLLGCLVAVGCLLAVGCRGWLGWRSSSCSLALLKAFSICGNAMFSSVMVGEGSKVEESAKLMRLWQMDGDTYVNLHSCTEFYCLVSGMHLSIFFWGGDERNTCSHLFEIKHLFWTSHIAIHCWGHFLAHLRSWISVSLSWKIPTKPWLNPMPSFRSSKDDFPWARRTLGTMSSTP